MNRIIEIPVCEPQKKSQGKKGKNRANGVWHRRWQIERTVLRHGSGVRELYRKVTLVYVNDKGRVMRTVTTQKGGR